MYTRLRDLLIEIFNLISSEWGILKFLAASIVALRAKVYNFRVIKLVGLSAPPSLQRASLGLRGKSLFLPHSGFYSSNFF